MAKIDYDPYAALTMRAQFILQGLGYSIKYHDLEEAIYNPAVELARQMNVGDTYSFPNGSEMMMIYKVTSNSLRSES